MALKIRLRQQGRKNHTVYRLVLTDSRSPRDGKYLETLGWYNPYGEGLDKKLSIQSERVQFWLAKGAILSERAENLLKQGSPQVVAGYKEKVLAQAAKLRDKRKQLRREKTKK
jgi:small subunit ribosomal protein S16